MSYKQRGGLWVACPFISLVLTGCAGSHIHSSVPAFAQAVTLTASNTESAFETIERKYEDVQALSLVVDWGQKPFRPTDIRNLLEPEDLQVRLKLLQSLQQYATHLESVSGPGPVSDVDSASKSLGTSLAALSQSDPLKKMASGTSVAPNAAAAAVDALGRWLVERKRDKALPGIINEMQQPIQTISTLLTEDIGTRDTVTDRGTGLRKQLWMEYQQAIMNQDLFIEHNAERFTPEEKLLEIEKLPAMVREQRLADLTMVQTQSTLLQLVKANDELLKSATTKQDLRANVNDLLVQAGQIRDFYQSLSSTK